MSVRNDDLATLGLIGVIAGIVATAAMTVAMDEMHERLPPQERYPLPPRELTEQILGSGDRADAERALIGATIASHFGYGAAFGALFALLTRCQARPGPLPGALFGVAVWTISYLGWIPIAGLLRPATRHPARRNGLMVAAHLVWGATLQLTADRLRGSLRPFMGGPFRDTSAHPAPPAFGPAVR